MRDKFTIGIDYGTLSARAIVARCSDGKIMASAVREYPHGVMNHFLPDKKTKLGTGWSLQHPMDYQKVLKIIVTEAMNKSGVGMEDVIGLAIDFTSCTVLPVDKEKVPLCIKMEYGDRPHAYVKLWKHHGAQREADEISQLLREDDALAGYREILGTHISSEVLFPKALEMIRQDYEIYQAADKILEAADWLTWVLTDSDKRSASMAGYKAWWLPQKGYPDKEFLKKIDVRMENLVEEKLAADICPVGSKIGSLNHEWSKRLGLKEGTAVAASVIDSHAGAPGSGICRKNQMMLVLGTSSVVMSLSDKPMNEKGICGAFKDGIVPGYYALESGLAAVGDMLGWFVEKCVPEDYQREARAKDMSIHQFLSDMAEQLKPGSNGLMALDWWNGNKTPFVNANLSGSLIGLTLETKPEEIYRALIEATAYGTRRIIEEMESSGNKIEEIVVSGGIAEKNPLFLRIYADVTGKLIKVAGCDQTAALGAAIYASMAAGKAEGGYDTYRDAVEAMSSVKDISYEPIRENQRIYDDLYQIYVEFGEWMGSRDVAWRKRGRR
ncbi:MAG: ribulokinase [Clostridia bacterium]|nr:ribulokinase [Clostridia bacterium]NCC42603.1 ribulokinase [Clostridia bacterium]